MGKFHGVAFAMRLKFVNYNFSLFSILNIFVEVSENFDLQFIVTTIADSVYPSILYALHV